MINLGNDHQMAANFMKKETTRYMPLGWNTPIRYSYQKEKLKSDQDFKSNYQFIENTSKRKTH